MWWLFAAEFKIINAGAEKGEGKLSCFIFPSITSGHHNHLTLGMALLALAKDFKHNFRKPSFSQISKPSVHAHTRKHTHTHTQLVFD